MDFGTLGQYGTDALTLAANPVLGAQMIAPGLAGSAASGIADWWKKRGPQAYQVPASPFEPGQLALANTLTAEMNGAGPNLAEAQLEQATNRNISNAAALQSSARGVDPALQARNLALSSADINQQAAGQSAIARLEQQLAAQQQLAGVLSSGRGGDIATAGINAGAQTANNQLNQGYAQMGVNALGSLLNAAGGSGILNSLTGGGAAAGAGGSAAGAAGGAGATGAGASGLTAGVAGLAFGDGGEVPMRAPYMLDVTDGAGVLPGVDQGVDDQVVRARSGEVFVNPENPIYPAARAAVEPTQPEMGHPMGRRILDWMRSGGKWLYDTAHDAAAYNGSVRNMSTAAPAA